MATLTIRNLDDRVKQRLRERAAMRGVSMEQEARTILGDVVDSGANTAGRQVSESLMDAIDRLKAKYGAFDLDIAERSTAVREPPTFD
jgi:plasmid stability protein